MDEYLEKLTSYLPIDFGNFENNEYKCYLVDTALENYRNSKYQFTLIAYHMLFMAFLYKEFWMLKEFSYDTVKKLCSNNNQLDKIETVFDSSIIPEQTFIEHYLSIFSWHTNKKSEIKYFVDKRDKCAHNSGFEQFKEDETITYFKEVLKYTEKIHLANQDNLESIFKTSIMKYLNGDTFETTKIIDFINREIAIKKYSLCDLKTILSIPILEIEDKSKSIAYLISMHYLELIYTNRTLQSYTKNESHNFLNLLIEFIVKIEYDVFEVLQIQIEDELQSIVDNGLDVDKILEQIRKRVL